MLYSISLLEKNTFTARLFCSSWLHSYLLANWGSAEDPDYFAWNLKSYLYLVLWFTLILHVFILCTVDWYIFYHSEPVGEYVGSMNRWCVHMLLLLVAKLLPRMFEFQGCPSLDEISSIESNPNITKLQLNLSHILNDTKVLHPM